MNTQNYYELLEVAPTASMDEVKKKVAAQRAELEILKRVPAKRALAEQLLAELEVVAAILLNPEARKRLDESITQSSAASTVQEAQDSQKDAAAGKRASGEKVDKGAGEGQPSNIQAVAAQAGEGQPSSIQATAAHAGEGQPSGIQAASAQATAAQAGSTAGMAAAGIAEGENRPAGEFGKNVNAGKETENKADKRKPAGEQFGLKAAETNSSVSEATGAASAAAAARKPSDQAEPAISGKPGAGAVESPFIKAPAAGAEAVENPFVKAPAPASAQAASPLLRPLKIELGPITNVSPPSLQPLPQAQSQSLAAPQLPAAAKPPSAGIPGAMPSAIRLRRVPEMVQKPGATPAAQPSSAETEAPGQTQDSPALGAQSRSKWAFIALAVVLAAVLISIGLYAGLRQPESSGASSAPAPPAQPTPVTPGKLVDLRPASPSLLNPPLIAGSAPAARNPQMAQGQVMIKHDAGGVKIIYPDGRVFEIDRQLYNVSGPANARFSSDYGTWVIATNATGQGNNSWQSTLNLEGLRDINGDGWPELALEDYSGGAHCCTALRLISLRAAGPALVFAGELGSASATMKDLDGDGRMEILTDHLFEYALGSFALGTFGFPVAYSAGPDGVYHVNTRAFRNWIQAGYEQQVSSLSASQEAEERDSTLINLFFLAYLAGRNDEAYSYLAKLQPLGEEQKPPLAILQNGLKDVAPEVIEEPAFQQLLAGLGTKPQETTQPSPSSTPVAAPAMPPEPHSSPRDATGPQSSAATASPTPEWKRFGR